MNIDYLTIRDQKCSNTICLQFNKNDPRNIALHSQKYKRFQCKTCKRTWTITKNSLFYKLKTEKSKILEAHKLIKNDLSIRKISQKLNLSPSTVQRWKNIFRKIERCSINLIT